VCDCDITLTLTLDPRRKEVEKIKRKRKLNKKTSAQALHIWHNPSTSLVTTTTK